MAAFTTFVRQNVTGVLLFLVGLCQIVVSINDCFCGAVAKSLGWKRRAEIRRIFLRDLSTFESLATASSAWGFTISYELINLHIFQLKLLFILFIPGHAVLSFGTEVCWQHLLSCPSARMMEWVSISNKIDFCQLQIHSALKKCPIFRISNMRIAKMTDEPVRYPHIITQKHCGRRKRCSGHTNRTTFAQNSTSWSRN